MILEKRSVLLILTLYFLCAFCDNDDAFAIQETINTMSAGSSRDFGSTENIASSVSHDPGEFTENPTSSASGDLESTETLASTTTYKSTTKLQTTDSSSETTDGSSTVTQTTKFTTFVPESTTFADNSTMTCDPATWPINASAETKDVLHLTVDDKSMEWIALSWESPCADATNVSVLYSVERYDGENYIQINETATRHNATNLDPCTQYTFIVRVITEYWISDGFNLTETTDYTISDIGDVLDLTHNVSMNVIELAWRAPVEHARCISSYSITQCDGSSSACSKINVSATNYTASDLEPCTEYHFTVKTLTPTVESAGVNDTAKTTSPKLAAPGSSTVTPGNFSLSVEWKPPKVGASCLKHYRVTVDPSNSTFYTTETNITIPHLHACKAYHVHITAVNENDVDGDTLPVNGETLGSKTNPPVSHSFLASANNISIIWSINKENNHCLLTDVVTMCNCTVRNGTGYESVDNISKTNITTRNATIISGTTVVTDLSPFTTYVCSAFTINNGEHSDPSELIQATTLQDVPSEPIVLPVKHSGDSWFLLTWESPRRLPGILAEFEISLEWEPLYPVPRWCAEEEPLKPIRVNGNMYDYNYTTARAFANYTVRMKAKTVGWGNPSEPQTFRTKHGIPEAITKMSAPIIRPSANDSNVLDTILTWGPPCSLNGVLEGYNVSFYGTRVCVKCKDHNFSTMHICTGSNNHMCSINLNELRGEYNYTFEVSAKVLYIDTPGPSKSQVVLYPAGIPPRPSQAYVQTITIDAYKAHRSTTTATVLLPLFSNANGDIKYYAVMVAMARHNEQSSARFELVTNDTWPDTSAWKEAMTSDFAIAYQATWKNWYPYPDQIADYGQMRAIKYTVGEDVSCKDISSKTDKPMYCNGPLKPDTWYHVRMRAFTNGGYADSDVFLIKTKSELDVALVIGAVFGILVVGIVVTMMLLVRKCSPYIVLRRFLHSDMPGSPVPAPFTRKKFISHCQQLIDNPGKLSNEFRLLQTLSVDLQMPTNTACLQANRKKNRYSDILPYDFSRVKLEVIDNDPNTDYINASFIRGYTGEDEYIACQGPKEETTYDFWRMVDQYNINIIIMLTQLVEKGKEKCHQYYPTIRETFRYENMTIRCTSELDYRTHTQRTLVLQKENKKRNITHLHFKDWPDHDVPEDFDAMINFCQIMRRNISANKGFIVAHCSAGIGRTGTLITIDILLQHLRDNRKLDVFGAVYRLRHNRINMVQRESQYAYIYNCIKQVLKNPYFLKTYKPPPVDPVYEKAGTNNTKDTMNSDMNLVSNLEISKEYSASTEFSESICNLSSRSTISSPARHQKSATIRGLRHYRSMGVINIKTRRITLGKSRTLDCVFYKALRGSSHELNRESVRQESLPLLSCSRSADVLDDCVQFADGQHVKETIES
ncbi:tyrosine-protein phosphatase 10D isoform X1 [Ooceraea biroi]|uniref:tyrosine-protein phosphatase 10D isoform X1 n=2 Tax=Ooceraea biroi TaxID=2015173 RepID=UPI000F07C718|nr:tyrosine-protein phosphatase 10D isoform X1 [Ooceraea biroi]XP_026828202.1 tyrosine-protein phosphatase 10D isoform X1 [Ooceraea biroi]XP_026828203.1 tyrosine-protein phosphatase 10D isoform X1 [Ooceraea biroi]